MKTMICLEASSYSSNAVFAYYRGNGWWSAYRKTNHPTRGYDTGEKFICKFKADDEAAAKAKWDKISSSRQP